MKTSNTSAVMLATALAVALGPLTSLHAAPVVNPRGEVTFTFVFEAPPDGELTGTIEGTFATVGAFRDTGAATETYTLTPVSPTLILASGMKILEGRRGTIVMTFTAELQPQENGGLGGQAHWTIVAGSGAYKKIRGSGEGAVWLEFPPDAAPYLAGEYTGSIQRDPKLRSSRRR